MASPMLLLASLPLPFLLLLLSPTDACSLAVGGCLPSKCSVLDWALTSVNKSLPAFMAAPYIYGPTNSADPEMGFIGGLANNRTGVRIDSSRGAAYLNFEVFPYIGTGPEAGFLLSANSRKNLSECCTLCAETDRCLLYQYFSSNDLTQIYNIQNYKGRANKWPAGHVDGMNCYLLTNGSVNESIRWGYPENTTIFSPYSGTHSQQNNATFLPYAPSWVGGRCNPGSGVTGDPHFVGYRGTKYEFNGAIDKTFSLITDARLQVNIKLGGYEDERTEGASSVKNGRAIRTWIRELGLIWLDQMGSKHTLVLKCRTGPQEDLGSGYISFLALDGRETPVPTVGSALTPEGSTGLSLQHLGVEKKGPYEVETFHLSLDGLADLRLELRPAHRLLRTQSDSFVHFSVFVEDLQATSKVHGVLGQTFRQTSSQIVRAVEYQILSRLVRGPITADTESGSGFLDGSVEDYVVPDILATESKYSGFGK